MTTIATTEDSTIRNGTETRTQTLENYTTRAIRTESANALISHVAKSAAPDPHTQSHETERLRTNERAAAARHHNPMTAMTTFDNNKYHTISASAIAIKRVCG